MNNSQFVSSVRQLQECEDLFETRLVQEISQKRFSIVHQTGSCYTVGLWQSYQHPELIIFGLPAQRGQKLLEQAVNHLPLELHQDTTSLTQDYSLRPLPVNMQYHREFLSYNRWFYRGDHFQAWQLIWPDADYRFPDDPKHPEHLRPLQPSLQ